MQAHKRRGLAPIPPVLQEEKAESVGTGNSREGAGDVFCAELS